ncbi:MAG: hypothetical protein HY703_02595 [Gemmatimonadetes bacterium]|nr:hypothetical protein [Gemmatimonadota bacterium]
MNVRHLSRFLPALLLLGCAVRLGGPGPVEYATLALDAGKGAPASAVAGQIRAAEARLVLLAATADSTWFAQVADQVGLELSGPGAAGSVSLAFLAGTPVGDTTIWLTVAPERRLAVHDALYRVDKSRFLDLLAVRVDSAADVRAAMRALLSYVATDVMNEAAVVLAVQLADPAAGDSVAALLRPPFEDVAACAGEQERAAASRAGMRLFYGPQLRVRCQTARLLSGERGSVLARLIVQR